MASNQQVAHAWANQTGKHQRGSNFFYDGPDLYSYGRHFCVGRIVKNKRGKCAYLLNSSLYSKSTSKHQYNAQRAIPDDATTFHVPGASGDHARNREEFRALIAEGLKYALKAIKPCNIMMGFEQAQRATGAFNDYSAFFSLRGRLPMPMLAHAKYADIAQRLARAEARKAEREARDAAKYEAERPAREAAERMRAQERYEKEAEDRARFRSGLRGPFYLAGPALLRIRGENVETSQGASATIAEVRDFLVLLRGLRAAHPVDWTRNPETPGDRLMLAGFELRSVTAEAVRIGCHVFEWPEIERVAGMLSAAP